LPADNFIASEFKREDETTGKRDKRISLESKF
jgi:hypothetical protein